MEILSPRMKYTHEIVGTHGGAVLCSWSVPLQHTPKQGQKDVINQLLKMAHMLVDTKVLYVEVSEVKIP